MTTAVPTEQRSPLRWVDGTMPALQERVLHIPVVGFIEYCLRGVGQVVFMNSPITGLLILVAAWITDPWFGFAGTIAVITSTLAGIALGFDRGAIHAGLYGFNGVLVGLGLALFLHPPWDVLVIVWIIVLSALSSVLMGALAAVFGGAWGVPPFTLAFNITTLLFLVTALQIAFGRLSALVEPALPAVNGPGVRVSLRETADATGSTDAMAILNAIFRGIGQLFFLNSILAGVLIIIGIAFCSRNAAGFALVPWGLPALTLPFCFGTLVFVLLKDASKHFTWVPPAEVVTPEEHLRRARTRQESSAPAADVETETA